MYGRSGAERREGGSGVGDILEMVGGSSVFVVGVGAMEYFRVVLGVGLSYGLVYVAVVTVGGILVVRSDAGSPMVKILWLVGKARRLCLSVLVGGWLVRVWRCVKVVCPFG